MTFERFRQSEFSYDSRPRHVAVADLNQDGHQDLVIANSALNNIGVRFGYGNGSFTDQIFYSTGTDSQPYWVAIKDFNRDRFVDIAVANYVSNSIGIFLGDGNGSFSNYKTFSLHASRPLVIRHWTFQRLTSHWDLAVVTNGTFYVVLLHGRGDGSFEIGMSYFMGYDSTPCSIIVTDLNGDIRSDIVTVNYGTSELVLFLSNGNDTYNIERHPTGINAHPTSVTVGYLNKDTYLDLAVANSATHNVGIFLGDDNVQFRKMKAYSASPN